MDKLKKHITNNRAELDKIEKPNVDKIWAGIQAKMSFENQEGKDKVIPLIQKENAVKQGRGFTLWTMAIAASVTLLIGLGIGYLLTQKVSEPAEFNLANYAPELAIADQDYRRLVNQKMSEINFQSIDTLAFNQVLQELKELEGEYKNWTADVPQYIHERELLDFLQRHYEQKIRILEILSKEIQKKVNYEEREIRL